MATIELCNKWKGALGYRFFIEKFISYLVEAQVIVYTDHAALKYLLTKKMLNQVNKMDSSTSKF